MRIAVASEEIKFFHDAGPEWTISGQDKHDVVNKDIAIIIRGFHAYKPLRKPQLVRG